MMLMYSARRGNWYCAFYWRVCQRMKGIAAANCFAPPSNLSSIRPPPCRHPFETRCMHSFVRTFHSRSMPCNLNSFGYVAVLSGGATKPASRGKSSTTASTTAAAAAGGSSQRESAAPETSGDYRQEAGAGRGGEEPSGSGSGYGAPTTTAATATASTSGNSDGSDQEHKVLVKYGQKLAGWLTGFGTTAFLVFYQWVVESAPPGSLRVRAPGT